MGPALSPGQVGQEAAACAVLGGLPRGRPGIFPGAGAGGASAGRAADGRPFAGHPELRGLPQRRGRAALVHAGGSHCRHCAGRAPVGGFRCGLWAGCCAGRWMGWQNTPRPMPRPVPPAKRRPKNAGTKKDLQKNRKRTCQVSGACCIIQTYQSKSTGAKSLLYVRGLTL